MKLTLSSPPVKGLQIAELFVKRELSNNPNAQFKVIVDILRICSELLEVFISISALDTL